MDVTILLEPKVDLKRLAEVLDGLGHEGRYHTIRTWSKHHHEVLYEAAKGFRPLELEDLVGGAGALEEVIHDGHNTLPAFTQFQKRFVKLEDDEAPVGGYNHQSMMGITGPGYFVASKGDGEHEGELVIDYTRVPRNKPAAWPSIRRNDSGLGAIVNGGMIDYVRGISTHVSIGVAFKNGEHRHQWFAMVRRDAVA